MLVKFHVNNSGKMEEVTNKTELNPVASPKPKKYLEEVDGELIEKIRVNVTEGYRCSMSGPDAARIAKAIGISKGFHNQGMWIISKSKYKKAQRYINCVGYREKLDNKVQLSKSLIEKRVERGLPKCFTPKVSLESLSKAKN